MYRALRARCIPRIWCILDAMLASETMRVLLAVLLGLTAAAANLLGGLPVVRRQSVAPVYTEAIFPSPWARVSCSATAVLRDDSGVVLKLRGDTFLHVSSNSTECGVRHLCFAGYLLVHFFEYYLWRRIFISVRKPTMRKCRTRMLATRLC